MTQIPHTYVHGHQASVLRAHSWRTVENSAPHLVAHLLTGASILDVGCGPGTITTDLADRVKPGEVIGIDAAEAVISRATALLTDGTTPNCRFAVGDVYALDFPDNRFDIVHAHQVLQHLKDPVAALAEMYRVTRPGGIIAVRDVDYGGMVWWPPDPMLTRWNELYHAICEADAVFADGGRHLLSWLQTLEGIDIEMSSSTWTFATPEMRARWGIVWADRVRDSHYASEAIRHGLSDPVELNAIAVAWLRWVDDPAGFFMVPHAQAIVTKR